MKMLKVVILMILVYKTNKGRTFEVNADEIRLQARGGRGRHTIRLRKGEEVVEVKIKGD